MTMLIYRDRSTMGNRNAAAVPPLNPVDNTGTDELVFEQPRDFHFAVTWITIFAHLDPVASAGPRPRPEPCPSPLALVPAIAPPARLPVDHDAGAAWEMVVPKMIRTGTRTFVPAETAEQP